MAFLHPSRASVLPRFRVITQAQKKQNAVADRAKKLGLTAPPYEFQEYIGKGAFGLVFKCQNTKTQEICAVKILDAESDYHNMMDYYHRNDSISDTIKEINALQALRDLKAENINNIHDAFNFDNQLWIVSDYAAGGSLSTLAKANNRKGIDEKYIIPIVRQVTNGLKSIHSHGFIHRDLKCGNILILESGEVQLCDFGVAGALESNVSKRTTVVGTPFWMPPELSDHLGDEDPNITYGTEVDIWALGCTVYEMATGRPPFVSLGNPKLLGMTLRNNPPTFEDETFSPPLRAFILRCLQTTPSQRPTAADLLQDPYLKNTEETYPASAIARVIEDYAMWQASGGQRHSLFNAYGASTEEDPMVPDLNSADEWNFSISDDLDRRMSVRMSLLPLPSNVPVGNGRTAPGMMPSMAQMIEDNKIRRGEGRLAGLFDTNRAAYDGEVSDLPLRKGFGSDKAGDRTTMIDLDDAFLAPDDGIDLNLNLGNVPTIKARRSTRSRDPSSDRESYNSTNSWRQTQEFKLSLDPPPGEENLQRRTQDWTFPWSQATESDTEPNRLSNRKTQDWKFPVSDNRRTQDWTFASAEPMRFSTGPGEFDSHDDGGFQRPPLMHAATMPVSKRRASPDRSSMIDMDEAGLEIEIPTFNDYDPRPYTAGTDSAVSDVTNGDPFGLEDQLSLSQEDSNRTSFHIKSQSEPTAGLEIASKDSVADEAASHARSSSMAGGRATTAANQRDSRESQLSRGSEATVIGNDENHLQKLKPRSRRPTGLGPEPSASQFTLTPALTELVIPPLPTQSTDSDAPYPRRGPNELNDFVFNSKAGFAGALSGTNSTAHAQNLSALKPLSTSRSKGSNGTSDQSHNHNRSDSGGDTINTLRPRFKSRTRGQPGAPGSKGSISSIGSNWHYRQSSTSSSASASNSAAAGTRAYPHPQLFANVQRSHTRQPSQQSSGSGSLPASLIHQPLGSSASFSSQSRGIPSSATTMTSGIAPGPALGGLYGGSSLSSPQANFLLAPGRSKEEIWEGMRPLLESLPAKNAALSRLWGEVCDMYLGPGRMGRGNLNGGGGTGPGGPGGAGGAGGAGLGDGGAAGRL